MTNFVNHSPYHWTTNPNLYFRKRRKLMMKRQKTMSDLAKMKMQDFWEWLNKRAIQRMKKKPVIKAVTKVMKAKKKQNPTKKNRKTLSKEAMMKVFAVKKISSIAACNQIVTKQSFLQTTYVTWMKSSIKSKICLRSWTKMNGHSNRLQRRWSPNQVSLQPK